MTLSHVSLFSGIGGMDLAAEAAGFETKLQVESSPFPLSILERHWPDVPRITDVREVVYDERWSKPTVVSGGFPCQPFSVAGKRAGTEDDRYLWPEMLRVIRELQPSWIVGENVHGLLSIDGGLEIERIMASLEAEAYSPWILNYPAAGVGAHHRRYRVFIVAYRFSERLEGHPGNEAGSIRQEWKFPKQERSAPSNGLRRSERGLSRTSCSKIGGAKTVPTPRATRGGSSSETVAMFGDDGLLNPSWTEWLMGFPIGWTNPEGYQE